MRRGKSRGRPRPLAKTPRFKTARAQSPRFKPARGQRGKVQRQAAAAREEAAVFKTARARLRSIPIAAQAKRILRRDLVFHFL